MRWQVLDFATLTLCFQSQTLTRLTRKENLREFSGQNFESSTMTCQERNVTINSRCASPWNLITWLQNEYPLDERSSAARDCKLRCPLRIDKTETVSQSPKTDTGVVKFFVSTFEPESERERIDRKNLFNENIASDLRVENNFLLADWKFIANNFPLFFLSTFCCTSTRESWKAETELMEKDLEWNCSDGLNWKLAG